MIVCPNCNHQNPDGANQCEACYTPLPATTSCPNCGAPVQADAAFCGQCGSNLRPSSSASTQVPETAVVGSSGVLPTIVSPSPTPDLVTPDPLVELQPLVTVPSSQPSSSSSPPPSTAPLPQTVATTGEPTVGEAKTTLQKPPSVRLVHVQTETVVELPVNFPVIHVGKPNDLVPPDVDVSGFPHSEVVSRVHADIRVEGDAYYLEDVGSSNGTYVNNTPLPKGNRHRLRPGDRISLGKGDLVSFLFQLS